MWFSPRYFLSVALFIIATMIFTASYADAAAPAELKDAIDQKSKELQAVTEKIRVLQTGLNVTQTQGKSIQKDIGNINGSINQVDLGIRSSELTMQKLSLEIDALRYQIADTEQGIAVKRASVFAALQALAEQDRETPLMIFLKNKTLGESVINAENLLALHHDLADALQQLQTLKINLASQLNDSSSKKQQVGTEHLNLQNKKIILAQLKQDKQTLLNQNKSQQQAYQKSLSDLEKRQADIAADIEALESQLRTQINPSALPAQRPGVLALPIQGTTVSQDYGATSFAKYGYRGRWHNGVDFAAPIGTPVYAAEKGSVIAVGNQDLYCYRGAYGKFIVIGHENNLTTLYAHLSLQIVHEGDTVERGQVIGYTGRTGYATGPHLHFTVYASPTVRINSSKSCGPKMPYGGDLNPMNYLAL